MIKRLWLIVAGLFLLAGCTALETGKPSVPDQESIIKSSNDNREYKILLLPNQLKVLLISDPDTEQAAAAMSIQTGQLDDPIDRQGLAHFLEHMLFLGNEKYPKPNAFGEFLAEHGGASNAFTGLEKTTFFFDINKPYLNEALDQFAQFFIAPTFNVEFVEREVNAVHSEHQKNLQVDERRIYQVIRHTANPDHPFSKFGTGNLETLYGAKRDPNELRDSLIAFFETNYSSNVMALTVLGEESLSELEEMVRRHYSAIVNKELEPDFYTDRPALPVAHDRTIAIKPIKAMRQARFQFPMPPQKELYLYKPTHLIAHLIGDESEGSVLASLKRLGWATALSAGTGFNNVGFSVFGITVDLTKEGEKHIDDIARRLFTYIDLIYQSENLNGYYSEMRQIAGIEFQFHDKEDPSMYASRLSGALLEEIPDSHVLAYPWLYEEYRPELVKDALRYLTPENLQIVLVGNHHPTDLIEPWYGTEYGIKQNLETSGWTDFSGIDDLALPAANPFIVSNVSLKPIADDTPNQNPVLLESGPNRRIWFKQDDRFRVPKGNILIRLSTPVAYDTVKNGALTKLYTQLLKDSLNEYSYPASVAGLNFSVHNSVQGIEFSFSGYSENIPKLLGKIADAALNLEIDNDRFQVFKHKMKENRQNQKLRQAFQRINYETYYLLSEPLWHTDDYLRVIDTLEPDDLKSFVPTLLSGVHVELLAHGNFDGAEIGQFTRELTDRFSRTESGVAGPRRERTLAIEEGESYGHAISVEDVNSAIQLYYQAGPQSIHQQVTLGALEKMIAKPFYHQLRTIEQLGYIVWSGYSQLNNIDGFYFIIQSNVREPVYLQARIEEFLKAHERELAKLTDEEFASYKEAMIAERLEKPKNLTEESRRYWREILSGDFDFEQKEKEIEAIKTLSLNSVRKLYHKLFIESSSVRRLSMRAVGKNHQIVETRDNQIEDRFEFKQNASFYENQENHQLLENFLN